MSADDDSVKYTKKSVAFSLAKLMKLEVRFQKKKISVEKKSSKEKRHPSANSSKKNSKKKNVGVKGRSRILWTVSILLHTHDSQDHAHEKDDESCQTARVGTRSTRVDHNLVNRDDEMMSYVLFKIGLYDNIQ